MKWPEEQVEVLKALWSDGRSASQIAHELHTTRSAILGKIHRLRLNNRDPSKSHCVSRPRAVREVEEDGSGIEFEYGLPCFVRHALELDA
jgi:hypothetical protein